MRPSPLRTNLRSRGSVYRGEECLVGVAIAERVAAGVGLAGALPAGLEMGNANVGDGDAPGVVDPPGDGDATGEAVDVALGEGEVVGVGVGVGGGGMMFSQ